jgi:membrane protease YdiL (CAAX protease family)
MQNLSGQIANLALVLLVFYAGSVIAHLIARRTNLRPYVIGALALLSGSLAVSGLTSLVMADALQQQAAALLLVIAALTALALAYPVRVFLARLTPLDPDSIVDLFGLVALLWGLTIGLLALFTVDLDAIKDQLQITVTDSLVNVVMYVGIAFALVGLWIVRGPREAAQRLGLTRPTWRQAAIAVALVVPMLLLSTGIDALGRLVQPERYAQLERVLNAMGSNVTNPAIALILGVCAGIGEELLFRGAIQPRFGIVLTTLFFGVAHTQYGPSFALLGVLFLGTTFALERKYMNTTTAIITHGLYNTVAFFLNYLTGGSS